LCFNFIALSLKARPARHPCQKELYLTCSEGADPSPERPTPRQQYRVLEGCPIKLNNGLECTKPRPISMPTAPQAYTRFIHPGCAARMETQ
jgi:hypothetical protein